MTDAELQMILVKNPQGVHQMWACRGAGKGCSRNKYRRRKTPCENCFGPLDETLTLEQVEARLRQGDA